MPCRATNAALVLFLYSRVFFFFFLLSCLVIFYAFLSEPNSGQGVHCPSTALPARFALILLGKLVSTRKGAPVYFLSSDPFKSHGNQEGLVAGCSLVHLVPHRQVIIIGDRRDERRI
jgi:hypothetical protein